MILQTRTIVALVILATVLIVAPLTVAFTLAAGNTTVIPGTTEYTSCSK